MHTKQPLLRAEGTTLHRQVFLLLREQIGRGQYAPGATLPTEDTLCQQLGVSRITVRRALQDLESEGLVERRQGRGTFVRESASGVESRPRLTLVGGLQRMALDTRVEVIEAGLRNPPPSIAALFEQEAGAEAVYALRVRRAAEVPLMITEAWLPARFARVVSMASLRKKALFELLLAAGVKFGRVLQEFSAEGADPRSARLLDVGIGTPIVRLTRVLHDAAGAPVQHLTVRLTPERSRVVMDIPASEVGTLSAGYVAHDVSPAIRALAKQDGPRPKRARGTAKHSRGHTE